MASAITPGSSPCGTLSDFVLQGPLRPVIRPQSRSARPRERPASLRRSFKRFLFDFFLTLPKLTHRAPRRHGVQHRGNGCSGDTLKVAGLSPVIGIFAQTWIEELLHSRWAFLRAIERSSGFGMGPRHTDTDTGPMAAPPFFEKAAATRRDTFELLCVHGRRCRRCGSRVGGQRFEVLLFLIAADS
jgi:hypothetical protein